jgi:hypothetical protein
VKNSDSFTNNSAIAGSFVPINSEPRMLTETKFP